jgi:hypothetical protein
LLLGIAQCTFVRASVAVRSSTISRCAYFPFRFSISDGVPAGRSCRHPLQEKRTPYRDTMWPSRATNWPARLVTRAKRGRNVRRGKDVGGQSVSTADSAASLAAYAVGQTAEASMAAVASDRAGRQ